MLAEVPFYWRQSLIDGIYTAFATPLRSGAGNRERFVGTTPALSLTWRATRHVSITALYSHFENGVFFQQAPPDRDVNYVGVSMTWF